MRAFMSRAGDGPFFLDCDRVPGYTFERPTEEYASLWAVNEARHVLASTEPGVPVVMPWDCVGWSETMCECNPQRPKHTHMTGHGFLSAGYSDERRALVGALDAFVEMI